MKKQFKNRSLNKAAIASFFTVLVVGFFIGVSCVQNGYKRSTLLVVASEGSTIVTVHYINVGQGDSIFIDTPNRDVLIDGGPEAATPTVLDYLENLNIAHIHLMIATHAHEDHIGGLATVLDSTIDVDEVLINNQAYTSNTYTNFMNLAQTHTVTIAERGQTFILTETANLTVFNPVQPLEFDNVNDNSIVVKLQVGNTSFLFTGDAEEHAEQSMLNAGLNLQSDVLKVGHHGSRTATTQSFLDSVAPSYAIISAGETNVYGHPHIETIDRLLMKGVTTYGTFKSGTIIASTDGTSIVLQGNPQPIPQFSPGLILPIFMITTLLIAMEHKKNMQQQFQTS